MTSKVTNRFAPALMITDKMDETEEIETLRGKVSALKWCFDTSREIHSRGGKSTVERLQGTCWVRLLAPEERV